MAKNKKNVWDKVVKYSPETETNYNLEGEEYHTPCMEEDKHGEYVALEDYLKLVDIIKTYQEMLYGVTEAK